MRRTTSIACLIVVAALGLASCASSLDTTADGSTTSAPKSTTTKKAANGNGEPGKCNAVKGYQQAYLIAMKPELAGKDQAEKDKVVKGITTSGDKLKKTVPSITAEVDLQITYVTKVVKGETPTPAEKDAADKARDKINLVKAGFCRDDEMPTTTKKP